MTETSARERAIGRTARVAAVGQVAFVLTWLVAGLWQRPTYDPVEHSISDMYADGAPGAWVLVIVLTAAGASVMLFCAFSLWPALRGAGWKAMTGTAFLALSIFGLGDLLTPFERLGCQLATTGCTPAAQLATSGGKADGLLSTAGVVLFVLAGFLLAAAMKATVGWQRWARPARLFSLVTLVLFCALGVTGAAGDSLPLGGLLERLLAFVGAMGIVVLAGVVVRQTSQPRTGRLSGTGTGAARARRR